MFYLTSAQYHPCMYHGYYYIFMCDFTFFVFLWYFYCISILMVADQLIGVEIYLNVANHKQNFIFFKIGKYALFIINFYLFTFKILKYLRKPYIYGIGQAIFAMSRREIIASCAFSHHSLSTPSDLHRLQATSTLFKHALTTLQVILILLLVFIHKLSCSLILIAIAL